MKITIEQAKEVAKQLKKEYRFGTAQCPKWFINAVPILEQDGSYSVGICIPAWNMITDAEQDAFMFHTFDGVVVHLRLTTPPLYNVGQGAKKKNEEN